MSQKPRYRIAVDAPLAAGGMVVLAGNPAHYLGHVLRLTAGDVVALFNREQGEWRARLTDLRKKDVTLQVEECLRLPNTKLDFTVCFAPIKGGRMETIIEKATELGASVLQPVLTQRTIVDRVNLERADAIAREAAEQCERIDWPVIREPVKLPVLLGNWPKDVPLVYGDESGVGIPITALQNPSPSRGEDGRGAVGGTAIAPHAPTPPLPLLGREKKAWGILAGPEGGFSAEEFGYLRHLKAGIGVGLGPRILRADTAIITLCAATLMAWGDWDQAPRFIAGEK